MPAAATGASRGDRKWRATAVSAETAAPATPADFHRAGGPASTAVTATVPAANPVVAPAATVAGADTAVVDMAAGADTVTSVKHPSANTKGLARKSGAFFVTGNWLT